MRLLLDEGLPRSAVDLLNISGINATHVHDENLTGATDEVLLRFAFENRMTIVCLDSDFHMILANTQASQPSVIRLRVSEMSSQRLVEALVDVVAQIGDKLLQGIAASVTDSDIRVHFLPLGSKNEG